MERQAPSTLQLHPKRFVIVIMKCFVIVISSSSITPEALCPPIQKMPASLPNSSLIPPPTQNRYRSSLENPEKYNQIPLKFPKLDPLRPISSAHALLHTPSQGFSNIASSFPSSLLSTKMPLSASKSTSKREISASAAKQHSPVDYRKKNRLQRSKSVSAVMRSDTETPVTLAGDDLSVAQFLNKRDNPLFCCSSLSSPEHDGCGDGCSTRKGRSVSRSIGPGNRTSESRNQSTRTLPRVGSEGQLQAISKREEAGECKEILNLRNEARDTYEPKFQKKKGATFKDYGVLKQRKNLQRWSSRPPFSNYCNTSHAISRKNFKDNIVEVDRENQDTLELVPDIRMEYEKMLKESHERARKLRADLAVEEQREQEISRMLKEIISDENSGPPKPRTRNKLSIEKLEMSKRLAEDAMSYFDECVSLSTFDSSDFSSTEDQRPNSIGIIPPLYGIRSLTSDGSTHTARVPSNYHLTHSEDVEIQSQCPVSAAGSNLVSISSCSSSQDASLPLNGQKHEKLSNIGGLVGGSIEISSVCESADNGDSLDFRTYIKRFEKKPNRSASNSEVSSSFNINDYNLDNSPESLLLDVLLLKNRIQSGSLLLCDIRIF